MIVDTDLSTDDAVALLFLAVDPRVDLRAVAVSGTGLVHCPVGARNALELLALAGRTDVPVACGRTEPLAGVNAVPDGWRQAADTLFGLTLPPAKSRPGASAVALIDKAIDGAPRPPTIVELAPMTNLGSAFRARPALAKKVRRVVAMAGAVAVPGNAPGDPATETNAWIDPRAAQIVAGSGAALTLVPLDATNDVPVTTFFARALKRYHYATPEATFVWDLVQATGMDRGDSYFWDPLAASVAVDPTLVRTSARHLDVNATSGRTTASPGGTTAVATSADRSRFERQLLSTLLRGAPFTIPPDRPDATLTLTSSGCTYSGATTLNAGPIVIDTINRTATPFGWAIGHLDGTHSLTDLRRYAARLQGRTITAPKWFTGDANGSPVPPHTRLTWQAAVALSTTGSAIFVCATMAPTHIWLPAVVPVYGSH
ncbi:MAG TPA: nucleoside hydrolase [Gaiellaceae bacterium]|nr:nucleoside hydrolase [Gaiellaceae bacterium]